MCGILFIAEPPSSSNRGAACEQYKLEDFLPLLLARGPDHVGTAAVDDAATGSCGRLVFAASVLQLRGSQACTSPVTDDHGNVLCFNGEVFGGLDVAPGRSDTLCLLAALSAAAAGDARDSPSGGVAQVLNQLRGPWSLVFWHAAARRLWFGRDVLGRRSLLVHWPAEDDAAEAAAAAGALPPRDCRFMLASVAPPHSPAWQQQQQELQHSAGSASAPSAATDACQQPVQRGVAAGAAEEEDADAEAAQHQAAGPWQELPPGLYSIDMDGDVAAHGVLARHAVRHSWIDAQLQTIEAYRRHSSASVGPGYQNSPAAGRLQQTGADGDDVHCLPSGEEPEASSSGRPDTGDGAFDVSTGVSGLKVAAEAQLSAHWLQDQRDAAAEQLLVCLEAAVAVRCTAIDRGPPAAPAAAAQPPVAILFSGGVDSVLLAALAHR